MVPVVVWRGERATLKSAFTNGSQNSLTHQRNPVSERKIDHLREHYRLETGFLISPSLRSMLLRDLQNHLKDRRRASLAELEQQFKIDADALRGMLEQLIRKGRVCKVNGKTCGGCHSCAPETIEIYEWIASQVN